MVFLFCALALLFLRHIFAIENPLWQLGLGCSFALSFWIQALAFREKSAEVQALTSQLSVHQSTVQNVEEELKRMQEQAQTLQVNFQEKVAFLQKDLEELQIEHSSILMLNEVLRKTTAKHMQEAKEAKSTVLLADQGLQATLERLYLREKLKAQEAEEEICTLKQHLKEMRAPPPPPPQPEENKVHLSQIEPLFKQLKQQFEEKNQILHQTRADLFKADTEVQRLRMEKAAIDLQPLPKEVEKELETLTRQLEVLEEENREMQEVITVLSAPTERKKKVKMQPPADQTLLF